MAVFQDPQWPRAGTWLSTERGDALHSIGVLSVPLNASITPGRCELAPSAIRSALQRYSLHDFTSGQSLDRFRLDDLGEIDLKSAEAFQPLTEAVEASLLSHEALILLGGDNSITRPSVRGLGELSRIGVLTLDAHLDVRESSKGPLNGNPIRMLVEDGLPGDHVIQLGVQSFANSTPYAIWAAEHGIRSIPVEQLWQKGIEGILTKSLRELAAKVDVIYIDLDLDVLDRAFAPACPGSRPGGLLPWQIRLAARICGRHPKVKAMDLVEIDPTKDVADVTCLAAAACLLEFAAGVLERP